MNYQDNDQDRFQQQLRKFIQALKQELLNPQILPFQKQSYTHLHKSLKQQESRIKQFIQPQSHPQSQSYSPDSTPHARNLKQLIFKCETEKVGYILKQYLRVRIKKIQRYGFYLYRNQNVAEKRLSESQYVFMKRYAEMKYKYIEDNVLKNIVKPYRGLGGLQTFFTKTKQTPLQIDTKQSRIEIPEPQLTDYIFCHILGNPDLYRFNSDIPVSNVEDNSIVPVNSVLYTQGKYVGKLVEEGNGVLI